MNILIILIKWTRWGLAKVDAGLKWAEFKLWHGGKDASKMDRQTKTGC
jgi:hypothetical protein